MVNVTFDKAYFNGNRDAGYSEYIRQTIPHKQYGDRLVDELKSENIDISSATVLIAGCARGLTAEHTYKKYGLDIYGLDICQWAVDNAASDVSGRIEQGDVRNSADIDSILNTAGVNEFDAVFTEALLSCLSDTDADTACTNLRNKSNLLIHRVWVRNLHTAYNYHTLSDWESVCDPNGQDNWYRNEDWI